MLAITRLLLGDTAAYMAGPEAAVGFLHRMRWGQPSLALDLMEEFRR
jgi:CRISPR/Cas system-associated endonuclease Cas1